MIAMDTMAARIHIRITRPTTLEALSLITFHPSFLRFKKSMYLRLHRLETDYKHMNYFFTSEVPAAGRIAFSSTFFSFLRAALVAVPTKLKKRIPAGIN
jgi:hypothetical protein